LFKLGDQNIIDLLILNTVFLVEELC